jgi:hypothetical protein
MTVRFLKVGIAAACLIVGGYVVADRSLDGWPVTFSIRNEVEHARCSLAFGNGWTWNVRLKTGEEKSWVFLSGAPESVDVTCQTAQRTITEHRTLDCPGSETHWITISDPKDESDHNMKDAFCIQT